MAEVKEIVSGMFEETRAEAEGEDFHGEDGLLYCGKCRTPKETVVPMPDFYNPDAPKKPKILPCVCKCRAEEMKRRKERDEYEEKMRRIEALRTSSLIESKFKEVRFKTFQRTAENEQIYKLAVKYVENFGEMYEKNQGLILWGTVGTGKSYTAACIANELLERLTTVVMTSFVKILQDVQKPDFDEKEYIRRLNEAKLLIIDDLGTERGTDYATEKVYNVIDSRYRAKKPMILTTNMTLGDMMNTTDIRYKRIYDRIFEMCYPVKMSGRSWREAEAARRFDAMKSFMEE